MRIGLDVDGCVYQWSPTVRRILEEEKGIIVSESETWNWIKDSIPQELWRWLWNDRVEEMFLTGDYYPGAQKAIDQLIWMKHEVYFITAAPEKVRQQRAINLFSHFPGIYGVNFVNPGSDSKTHIVCDIYLDDKPETALNTAVLGHRSMLMDRPWNANIVFHHNNLVRVHSWDDVVTQVSKYATIQ